MASELEEMLDHHRIRKVLAEYCRGSDRVDQPRMGGVYAADSIDEHGLINTSGPEFVSLICPMTRDTTETLSHLLGQSRIEINGDSAGAETYFLAVATTLGRSGERECNQLGGRFIDRLVREDGAWKVKHRIAVRDWSIAMPIDKDWETSRSLRSGARSATDPSYAVLGQTHGGLLHSAGVY